MRRSKKILLVVGVVFIVVIAGLVLAFGVEAWMRKADPLRDVPSAEFQKTTSKTQAAIGDIFTVDVFIGWHGHVLPESHRHVEVFDLYPEDYFTLAGGNNTCEYDGYGPHGIHVQSQSCGRRWQNHSAARPDILLRWSRNTA